MNAKDQTEPQAKAPTPRARTYQKPRLRLLGSLRGLTKTGTGVGDPESIWDPTAVNSP